MLDMMELIYLNIKRVSCDRADNNILIINMLDVMELKYF